MAVKKGTEVDFRYRLAHPKGKVVGVAKRGKTAKTTMLDIRPDKSSRHPGEPAIVHRRASKVRPSKRG